MERFPLGKPLHCLLPTNTNSTVRQYADEFVFVKYPYLLSKSFQCVEFLDTLKVRCKPPLFCKKLHYFQNTIDKW